MQAARRPSLRRSKTLKLSYVFMVYSLRNHSIAKVLFLTFDVRHSHFSLQLRSPFHHYFQQEFLLIFTFQFDAIQPCSAQKKLVNALAF